MNVKMSEGTFCRVEVHINVGCNGVFITRTCYPDEIESALLNTHTYGFWFGFNKV